MSTVISYGSVFGFLAAPPFVSQVFQSYFWNGSRFPNHPFLDNNPYINSVPVIAEGMSPFLMLVRLFEDRGIYTTHTSVELWITNPWPIFFTVIPLLILLFIALSVYLLHPVRPKPKWWKQIQLKRRSVEG
ncbi:hypothetical protein [Effusibacillus consociatus]|uniref:Uncharacterized protein n=1 Tax=Effusibacillus consociatus TaxID=1117041 RepID=A0ABV9Q3J4_9BACL